MTTWHITAPNLVGGGLSSETSAKEHGTPAKPGGLNYAFIFYWLLMIRPVASFIKCAMAERGS